MPQLGYGVCPTNRATDAWTTTLGGEFLAVGTRAAIAGRRADLIVMDDPVGSQADADSVVQRDHLWDWFRSDLITRLRPAGKIVLIMTRWHPDDLGGRILERSGTEWRIVRLPALAEPDDPLGRTEGAPLWPEWESRDALLRKREILGDRAWSALFQQSPQPTTGRLFCVDQIAIIDVAAAQSPVTVVRAWDLAATSATGHNDPDWTVGVKLGRLPSDRYIILDVVRTRGSPREVEELIVATAKRDGVSVAVAIPEDPGQAGKSQSSYLVRQLAGFIVVASRETGSKATRAMPLASQMEAGNVLALRALWNHELIEELRDFPFGRKDDQVDALSRAFVTICNRPRPTRSMLAPIFQR
jgi:predicted phage terminase large subunit-like protein